MRSLGVRDMDNGFKPYYEYKEAGLPWLSNIPYHWEMNRNKNVLTLKKVRVGESHGQHILLSLTKQGIIARDMVNIKGKFPKEFDTYQEVNPGDIIFCLFDVDETPRSVGLSTLSGMITGAYTVFEVKDINKKYLYYYYLALDNHKQLKPLYSGLRKVINSDTFLRTKMPYPPREEQDQIVRYLDSKLAKINKYIKNKKKLIELLKEQKQAIINQAITKGLDPNAKMKPSGIEWLGDIPEGWEVIKIKRLFNEIDERNTELKYILLTFSRNKGLIPFSENSDKVPSGSDLSIYKVVKKGNLLMNKMQAWSGMFISAKTYGSVSPDYSVFEPSKLANVDFYEYVFRNPIQVEQFANASKGVGSGFNRLYTPAFGDIFTVMPPLQEQEEIVKYLQIKTQAIDKAVEIIKKEIDLITEYRTILISAVVTGKVDVRNIEIEGSREEIEEDVEDPALETLEGEEISMGKEG